MLSYRFMQMRMDGNRDGTDRVDPDAVVDPGEFNFTIAPTRMPMSMHMVGLMYAPTGAVTLMVMVPFISLDMDHVTRAGGAFSTSTSGIGDVKVSAMITVARPGNQRVHISAGVGLPTGSIEKSDVTPMSAPNETQLPYPMQTGSGTFDLLPGVTYLGQSADWSWGGQAGATIRIGENDQDYRLGNKMSATAWGARQVSRNVSTSVRLVLTDWGNISGASPAYANAVMMRMVPTAFTDLRGGTRLDAGLGTNLHIRGGSLQGLRLAVEGSLPIYQSLDGPQLETDWQLMVGMQYAF